MFGKFFKAKGKLYLCSLFALCAVLLCCATFAFCNIFGAKNTSENNSQTNNSLTANAANSYTLNGTTCAAQATIWTNAVKYSIANNVQVTVTMTQEV